MAIRNSVTLHIIFDTPCKKTHCKMHNVKKIIVEGRLSIKTQLKIEHLRPLTGSRKVLENIPAYTCIYIL